MRIALIALAISATAGESLAGRGELFTPELSISNGYERGYTAIALAHVTEVSTPVVNGKKLGWQAKATITRVLSGSTAVRAVDLPRPVSSCGPVMPKAKVGEEWVVYFNATDGWISAYPRAIAKAADPHLPLAANAPP